MGAQANPQNVLFQTDQRIFFFSPNMQRCQISKLNKVRMKRTVLNPHIWRASRREPSDTRSVIRVVALWINPLKFFFNFFFCQQMCVTKACVRSSSAKSNASWDMLRQNGTPSHPSRRSKPPPEWQLLGAHRSAPSSAHFPAASKSYYTFTGLWIVCAEERGENANISCQNARAGLRKHTSVHLLVVFEILHNKPWTRRSALIAASEELLCFRSKSISFSQITDWWG